MPNSAQMLHFTAFKMASLKITAAWGAFIYSQKVTITSAPPPNLI